jgi:hypothetical protein
VGSIRVLLRINGELVGCLVLSYRRIIFVEGIRGGSGGSRGTVAVVSRVVFGNIMHNILSSEEP